MELKELRRTQRLRESLGYLLLPALYAGLMASGAFLVVPSLVLLSFALVVMLLLQARAGQIASRLTPRQARPARDQRLPADALEAADARFLRQVAYTVAANAAGYLVFLAAVDLHLKASLRGDAASGVLLYGALGGIAIVIAGREAARLAAWSGFERRFPALWASPTGLDRGKSTRSAREYLDWRCEVSPAA